MGSLLRLLKATGLLNEAEEAIDEEAFQARDLSLILAFHVRSIVGCPCQGS